jgi:hypothetical protein
MSSDIIIAEIPKGASQNVIVAIREFKGARFVDLRLHVLERGGSSFRPSTKGITLRPEMLPAMVTAMQKAERIAREAGLLDDDID